MRIGFGALLAIFGIIPAWNLWFTALGRLYLFVFDCQCQRGMNHSDDYTWVYSMNCWLLPIGMCSVLSLWRQSTKWRWLALGIFLANLLAMFTFLVMHRVGVLVSYEEYIGR